MGGEVMPIPWNELEGAMVISCENVARHYFCESPQESWELGTDIPNVAPPLDNFFLEMHAPNIIWSAEYGVQAWNARPRPHAWGIHAFAFELGDGDERSENTFSYMVRADARLGALRDSIRWVLILHFYIEHSKGKPYGPMSVTLIPVRHDGGFVMVPGESGQSFMMMQLPVFGESGHPADFQQALLQEQKQWMYPLFLSLSFMHCKNVSLSGIEPRPKISRRHEKRHGRPLTRYYTLEIEPMKQILRTEGRSDEVGLKRALHICRGHFATYSPEKPLFGKYAGTFWKPQHVRGSKERGEVLKDYDVNPPT